MPSGEFYRSQAQLFATLALAAADEGSAARYNLMALEYLAKADEVEPNAGAPQPHTRTDDGSSSDMDRD